MVFLRIIRLAKPCSCFIRRYHVFQQAIDTYMHCLEESVIQGPGKVSLRSFQLYMIANFSNSSKLMLKSYTFKNEVSMPLSLGVSYLSYCGNVGNPLPLRIANWARVLHLLRGPGSALDRAPSCACDLRKPLYLWTSLIFIIYKMEGMNFQMLWQSGKVKLHFSQVYKMEKKFLPLLSIIFYKYVL